jgi:hypothetical protein
MFNPPDRKNKICYNCLKFNIFGEHFSACIPISTCIRIVIWAPLTAIRNRNSNIYVWISACYGTGISACEGISITIIQVTNCRGRSMRRN